MLVKLKRSFFGPNGQFYEVVNGAPVTIDETWFKDLPPDAEILSGAPLDAPLDTTLDPLDSKKK